MPNRYGQSYYRARAVELRRLAETATEADCAIHLEMAKGYDILVEDAARTATRLPGNRGAFPNG